MRYQGILKLQTLLQSFCKVIWKNIVYSQQFVTWLIKKRMYEGLPPIPISVLHRVRSWIEYLLNVCRATPISYLVKFTCQLNLTVLWDFNNILLLYLLWHLMSKPHNYFMKPCVLINKICNTNWTYSATFWYKNNKNVC